MNPILPSEDLPQFGSIREVHHTLHTRGCQRCDLGFQPGLNGCCVSRGTFNTNKMIVGEAPGKHEDAKGMPFTGPAGQLLDQIWASAGMNTNDWYITNMVHCRPIAEKGSGKENLTPKTTQLERCRPYVDEEIRLLKPKLIVTIGAIATANLLGVKHFKMGDYRGKLYDAILGGWSELPIKVFPMIHPAAILHAKGNEEKYNLYRSQTWQDVQVLKKIVDSLEEN
jgi:uracil-DNA glycosylase